MYILKSVLFIISMCILGSGLFMYLYKIKELFFLIEYLLFFSMYIFWIDYHPSRINQSYFLYF